MEKVGAAVIGCGAIYGVHADALQESEYAKLLYVVDIREERAKKAADRYSCQWETDYRKILDNKDIQVIHVCTPHHLHAEMAIEGLKAGKHVLVEKPVTINVEQAKLMLKASKKYKGFLGVCFQNRYNPTSVVAKQILDSGELGKILGIKGIVTWSRDKEYYLSSGWRGSFNTEGGGVLINQSIHTLDLMQWFGGDVESIRGSVSTKYLGDAIEVEDTADAVINFKNGARGIFYATNCYTTNSPVELEIHCEKGTLTIRDGELIKSSDGVKQKIVDENNRSSPYKSYWGRSHATLIRHFYEAIRNSDPKGVISVEEGMKSLKIIDGIYKSASTGNRIRIN